MRYIIQVMAIIGDILLIVAAVYFIFVCYDNLFTYLIVLYAFHVWRKQGGFMAWRKVTRQRFLANAKAIGL